MPPRVPVVCRVPFHLPPRAGLAAWILASLGVAAPAQAAWPSLDRAVRLARTRAPEVAAAQGEVRVAEAAGVKARLPGVGNPFVQVFVDRSRTSPNAYVQPELYVPINVPGQRSARIETANRQLTWRRAEQEGAEGMALGEVVRTYGNAEVEFARVRLAQSAEDLAREEAEFSRERAALGDATTIDVNLARSEVARYAQQKAEARARFVAARARLAALTGMTDLTEPAGTPALPAPPGALKADTVVARVEEAPVLDALKAQEHFWTAARTQAEADRIPPITFIMWGARTESGDVRAGGGLGWTIPMLDRNQAEVARVLAERSRVQLTAQATRQVLHARTQGALGTWQALTDALREVDEHGIPAAQAVVDATLESQRAGKVDRLRVILARRDLVAAQDRRLQLMDAAWNAYGELAAVLGEMP